jgi:hypothetical protein
MEYKSRFGNLSFTSENIEEFIKNFNDQKDLLPLYLDRIRNGYLFTETMLENIEKFDNSSKMKIIRDFNRVIEIFNENK